MVTSFEILHENRWIMISLESFAITIYLILLIFTIKNKKGKRLIIIEVLTLITSIIGIFAFTVTDHVTFFLVTQINLMFFNITHWYFIWRYWYAAGDLHAQT